jgi:pyruvate formate lyase activating enzyme
MDRSDTVPEDPTAASLVSAELPAGNRHDLRHDLSPDAPEIENYLEGEGSFGYVHSYETGSRLDGPGIRVTLFVSGCPLRCQYCHNPDTWHLKHGTRISLEHVVKRLGDFAPALRSMKGGLTISGGEPLVQPAYTRRIFAGAKSLGLNTALDTSGFLGERATDEYLQSVDLVLLDIKSWDPETYRRVTRQEVAPTLRFAERLASMSKPVWVRFVLVPGLTDDPDNVAGVANFVAPMQNVEWVEVLPFHQLGAFKWRDLGLGYQLADTPPASPELTARVIGQFRDAGCNVR